MRYPRQGKIRLGIKVEGNKGPYPKAVDYFVCPDEVKVVYGDNPKELKIMFPTEDETQWASQFYRCYSQTRGLVCKGDGEIATALVDTKTGVIAAKDAANTELREVPCIPETCPMMENSHCKPVMNLQFLLPEVEGFGIWQLDTTSFHSIRNVNSSLKLIRGICGRVSMIPLTLSVIPLEVQPNGTKKTIYVLQIDAPYTISDMLNRTHTLPEPPNTLLPPPDLEPPDDLFPPEILEEPIPESKLPAHNWGAFWNEVRKLGYTRDQVHKKLDVTSLKEWVEQGKPLQDAVLILSGRASANSAPSTKDFYKTLGWDSEQQSRWFKDNYSSTEEALTPEQYKDALKKLADLVALKISG
ncbi:MAG: hypothetical protein SVK08_00740 [Halobacteriota archaeon]|nr:hypothetical protein [Halobacteriota archaeon]